uniref:Uncharacterized protein n=1 Tax=Rhizophora mucronata TaxID=61149 RepID=A0A2P2PHB3_RHIMU
MKFSDYHLATSKEAKQNPKVPTKSQNHKLQHSESGYHQGQTRAHVKHKNHRVSTTTTFLPSLQLLLSWVSK